MNKGEEMTPLEEEVLGKVLSGDTSWLPDGMLFHGLAAEEEDDDDKGAVAQWSPERMDSLEDTVTTILERMGAIEDLLKDR